ncbi:hypothetical protein ABEF95_017180 [Exophiala dermatitidis]
MTQIPAILEPTAVENDTATESNSEMPVDQVTDLETNTEPAENEDKLVPDNNDIDNTTEEKKLNTIIEPESPTTDIEEKTSMSYTYDTNNVEAETQAISETSGGSKPSLSLTTTTILLSLTAGALVIGVRSPFVSTCMLYGVISYAKYKLL